MFNIVSNYNYYWKGEGFASRLSDITDCETLEELYYDSSIDDRDSKAIKILSRKYPFFRHVLKMGKSVCTKSEYNIYFNFCVRCVCFDLDLLNRQEDDLTFTPVIRKIFEKILMKKIGVRNGIDKIPSRFSSETFFYVCCLIGFSKFVDMKLGVSLVYSDGYLITMIPTDKELVKPNYSSYSDIILRHNFNIEENATNFGRYILDDTAFWWFAWNS